MIDRLCASGVVFEHAYAQSSWAPASIASLLTSRLPSEHGLRAGADSLGPDRRTFLASFKAAGYTTIAYAADVDGGRGLERDFTEYHPLPSLAAPPPEGAASNAIERVALPLAVWLELHLRELREEKVLVYFRYDGTTLGRVPPLTYLQRFSLTPLEPPRPGDRDALQATYDASVAELDASLETILDVLRKPELIRRLWIVLLAPYATALGEHDTFGHGSTLHEEQIHVPLVFVPPPGQRAGTRYAGVVQLLDVAPTLLELAGLPPDPDFRGRSLRLALDGAALVDRDAVAELVPADPTRGHTRAVVGPQLRKWLERVDGTHVAYDLRSDPGELLPQASPAAVPSAQPPP
jgi:arylsulfatase A-like enzyme